MAEAQIIAELQADLDEAAEWLLNYAARLKQWQQDGNSIREENNAPEIYIKTGPNKNIIMQKVISLAELDYAENWLLAVEILVETLDDEKRNFLEIRREAHKKTQYLGIRGRPAWRGYVRQQWEHTEHGPITDNNISDWWQELIQLMRLIALKRGCYKK